MVAAPLMGRLPRDSKKEDENWRRRSVSPRRGSVTSSTASARSRRARIFGCADSSVSRMATRCGPWRHTTSRSRCETSEANWRRSSRGPGPPPDKSVRGGYKVRFCEVSYIRPKDLSLIFSPCYWTKRAALSKWVLRLRPPHQPICAPLASLIHHVVEFVRQPRCSKAGTSR